MDQELGRWTLFGLADGWQLYQVAADGAFGEDIKLPTPADRVVVGTDQGSSVKDSLLYDRVIGSDSSDIRENELVNTEDREAITHLINQHGYLLDTGQLDSLHEIFTADVAYDVSDFGGGVINGLEAMRDWVLALGDRNPVGHHVTNIVLDEITDDVVRCLSKGIGISVDGTVRSVTYDDHIERSEAGWRVTRRAVKARRSPLHP